MANLLGVVLPVMDLSLRIGWSASDATPCNPIIVTEHEQQSHGLIAYHVNDFISVNTGTMQKPDASLAYTITQFVKRVVPLDEQIIMVLDVAPLMCDQSLDITE